VASKTTLVKLLMRFYELNSGRITIGGYKQVEVGNHDSLMAKKGFYADLYQSQFEHSEE
jgi:ABC-type multidrug transport system fused ATPase/permease subunit